ncbi:MAG: hypothetical protein ABR614_02970 [Mycobacteriales bacterium]
MHVLRTPDSRFTTLPDFPYAPQYVDIPGGGHFLREDVGVQRAQVLSGFMRATPRW